MTEKALDVEKNPIREILALRDYRLFWGAQLLITLIQGISRFAFVWLALEISTSATVVALLGLSLGIPGLLFSLPAGAAADRLDKQKIIIYISLLGVFFLGMTSVLIQYDIINLPLALVVAFGTGSAISILIPVLQAMIPQLVPADRLMSAVGLQNMGQGGATILGALIGGGAIKLFGLAAAFGLFAIIMLLGSILIWFVKLSTSLSATNIESKQDNSLVNDIAIGLKYVALHPQLRILISIGILMGVGSGSYSLLLPEIAKNELLLDSFETSSLLAFFSTGMIITSVFIATKSNISRKGLIFAIAANCFGPGLIIIGFLSNYLLILTVMIIWGGCGGVMLTMQRTLLYNYTAEHMQGRVFALFSLVLHGFLPIAAIFIGISRIWLNPTNTLIVIGTIALIGILVITTRASSLRQGI